MSNTLTGPLTLLQAAAITEWYERFAPALRAHLIRTTTLRGDDLDDVLQDVWVQAVRYAAKLATLSDAHRRNYLFDIVRSVVTTRARRVQSGIDRRWDAGKAAIDRAAHFSAFADPGALDAQPVTASHDWIAHSEMEQTTAARLSLRAVWDALPAPYRELVTLFAEGLTEAEMATRLGVNRGTVAQRIYRMRGILRQIGERVA